MPLKDLFSLVTSTNSDRRQTSGKILDRLKDAARETWYLGFTAFGGPPVHFQIFHQKFVESKDGKTPWISEQTVSKGFVEDSILIESSIKNYSRSVKACQVLQAQNFSSLYHWFIRDGLLQCWFS